MVSRLLVLGEVHTGLLRHSSALSAPLCGRVLDLLRGVPVRRYERPIAHTASPDLLTGVDCRLPSGAGVRVRGIGTVTYRAAVTAGQVLQGSATVRVVAGKAGHRHPWSHYLGRPGVVEAHGEPGWDDLAQGFLTWQRAGSALDLGGVSGRVMHAVQASPELDRSPPFRAVRTRLRWAALATAARAGEVTFAIDGDRSRSLRLTCTEQQAATVAGFCEDLALHDWLLTALLSIIERSQLGGGGSPERTLGRLRPAIDHLLHLWMPAARLSPDLREWWAEMERCTGFSRQWEASVNRIRDHLMMSAVTALEAGLGGANE